MSITFMRIKQFTFTNKCLYTTNNICIVREDSHDLPIPMHVANAVIYLMLNDEILSSISEIHTVSDIGMRSFS